MDPRERADEIAAHLDLYAEELIARGVDPDAARRQARLKFGNPRVTLEHLESLSRPTTMDTIGRDLRSALRSLRGAPGFAAIAVASLALGLGATTTLFSLVDALLLRSLPVVEPERLVAVQRMDRAIGKRTPVDGAALDALRSLDVFAGVASHTVLYQPRVSIDGETEPERVVAACTADFLTVAGVRPALGRMRSDSPAAVISHRLWNGRFRRASDVLTRTLVVNDRSYPVVGVASRAFLGVSLDSSVDVWLLSPQLDVAAPSALARLAPGVDVERASAAAIARLDAEPSPLGAPGSRSLGTTVVPAGRGASSLREQYRGPLLALAALVVLVLLVTCTNVANLLVVRNASRLHELTVRMSLGASRARLVTQLLAESAIIAIVGGVAGWALARWSVGVLLAMLPLSTIPDQLQFQTDARLVAFLATLAMTGAMLFGFAPAWRATRIDVTGVLRAGHATSQTTRRLGLWLVAGQIALSVVLAAGAGLFFQTLRNMTHVDLGFDERHLIQAEFDRGFRIRPQEVRAIEQQLVERVAAVPGISAVTLGNPLFPSWAMSMEQPAEYSGQPVPANYFETLGIPLVKGRLFTPGDVGRPVAIVNETYAREMLPGQDPIGKPAGFNHLPVVGVVKDHRSTNIRWNEATAYRIALPDGRLMAGLIARTREDPGALVAGVRQAIASVNPRLALSVRPVDDAIDRSLVRERLVASISVAFAALGLLLAGIGLFGVAAYSVAQRTAELGLRMALGATRARVVGESLRETTRVFGGGLAVGVGAAIVAARASATYIEGLLFGINPTDWITVLASGLVMAAVAAAACAVPALRATRIDPLKAIRYE